MTTELHSGLALRVAGLLDAGMSASAIRAEHPLPPDEPQAAEAWILSVLDFIDHRLRMFYANTHCKWLSL